jgi:hypothetical protein
MAAYFDIEQFPKNPILGFQHRFRVTARRASGAIDAAYAGLAYFTSSDTEIAIVPLYPALGLAIPGGTKIFNVKMGTEGSQTVTVQDGSAAAATARCVVRAHPIGWGLEDEGFMPYGDATSGIGVSLRKAKAVTTREVDVTVSNLVQDNSPFLAGDALNPATWSVQRLDTAELLHVVSVEQVGTYTYRLLTLEELGPVSVTHRANSTTLKDISGAVIVSPRNADFLGLLDAEKTSEQRQFNASKSAVRDFANPQVPQPNWQAGTLQLTAGGDYKLESGAQLVRKLILRRLVTTPGDFFHLPNYGIGIKVKEPIASTKLAALKTEIEQQCLREREVAQASAAVTLATNGVLTVTVRARLRPTGEILEIGFKSDDKGLVL